MTRLVLRIDLPHLVTASHAVKMKLEEMDRWIRVFPDDQVTEEQARMRAEYRQQLAACSAALTIALVDGGRRV